jgi:hypothetical protein
LGTYKAKEQSQGNHGGIEFEMSGEHVALLEFQIGDSFDLVDDYHLITITETDHLSPHAHG